VIGETVDAQLVGRNRGVPHIVTGSHGRIGWVFAVVLSALSSVLVLLMGVASHPRLSLRRAEPDSLTLCAAVRVSAGQRWRGPIKVTGQVDELIRRRGDGGYLDCLSRRTARCDQVVQPGRPNPGGGRTDRA
jgi:hypothetical protein